MSISRPPYPWILKDLGWFEALAGLRPTMARKTDKKLMTQSHSSWTNRRSPASEIAKSKTADTNRPFSPGIGLTLVGHLSH